MTANPSEPTRLIDLEAPVQQLRQQFDALVAEHRPHLWRYCLKLTGSPWDAEDLVQDAFVRAFTHVAMLAHADNPRAYLFRVASNAWIDTRRRAKPVADLDAAAEVPAPETAATPWETNDALEAVVTHLPPRQRVVFLLVDAFSFRTSEVAVMLRSSEGAIKAMLHRARSTLRAAVTRPADAAVKAAPPAPLVRRYVDALNRRDPDALVALFDPIAINELVGLGELVGLDMLRMVFLRWAADPQGQSAEVATVDGREVVFVYSKAADGSKSLTAVVDLIVEGDRIVAQRWYQGSRELLTYATSAAQHPGEH